MLEAWPAGWGKFLPSLLDTGEIHLKYYAFSSKGSWRNCREFSRRPPRWPETHESWMSSKEELRELDLFPPVKKLRSHLTASYNYLKRICEDDGTELFGSAWWYKEQWPHNEAPGVQSCANSPASSRRLGWSPSEVLNKSFFNLVKSSLKLWGKMCNSCVPLWSWSKQNLIWRAWMWLCSDVFWVTNAVRRWEGGTNWKHLGCHCMAKSPTTLVFCLATCTYLMWLWL